MLHLLRRIRNKLLQKGKFKNYFFYTIGEIFLVVIGILIALQINNINQKRLDRVEAQNVLSRLVDASFPAFSEVDISVGDSITFNVVS